MISRPFPHKPIDDRWKIFGFTPDGVAWVRHLKGGAVIFAISGVALVREEHRPDNYQWLVSFSRNVGRGPERIPNTEMRWIRKEWDVTEEWEEDNHEAGNARKFFLPVDPKHRGLECPCKDETVIVEGDYQYSIKKPLIGERS